MCSGPEKFSSENAGVSSLLLSIDVVLHGDLSMTIILPEIAFLSKQKRAKGRIPLYASYAMKSYEEKKESSMKCITARVAVLCLIICSFIVTPFSIVASYKTEEALLPGDVRAIMDQLFEYHIDQKEMSMLILKRSLKVYIDYFDEDGIYLLQDEALPYLEPSNNLLDEMLQSYNRDNYSHYYRLYSTIRKAIIRTRILRRDILENEKSYLFFEAKNRTEMSNFAGFPRDEEAVEERIRQWIIDFIWSQLKKIDHEDITEEDKDDILTLFTKRSIGHEDHYLGDEMGSEHTFLVTVLKALARSLDSHTAYFSAEEAFEMKTRLEKGLLGIGVVLNEDYKGVTIVRLIKGGPAAKSGMIQEDDIIKEIDGRDISNVTFRDVLNSIRGPEGSTVELGLDREGAYERIYVDVPREQISIDEDRVDVSREFFGDGVIGKIALHAFYEGDDGISSVEDVREALIELQQEHNLKGVILDLRDNRGGFLMQAVKVAGLFISNGMVVVSKYSDGRMKYFRDIDGYTYFDGPIVILTSKASASAAEIVAQALQDYGVAVIVGDEKTYGKGSIQHQTVTNSNDANAFFKVTVGRYYTVSGRSTQIDGVRADVVVPSILHEDLLGEEYLDFPLPNDSISSYYHDDFVDLEREAQEWFVTYYLPSLQQKEEFWYDMLPILQENSHRRLADNMRYEMFLDGDLTDVDEEESEFSLDDMQVVEAVNIIQDMILLESERQFFHYPEYVQSVEDYFREKEESGSGR